MDRVCVATVNLDRDGDTNVTADGENADGRLEMEEVLPCYI
jgi:hypothetical protein